MDNTDWKEKIVQLRKRDRLRRANAIHLHCVDCVIRCYKVHMLSLPFMGMENRRIYAACKA